jgi:hypothetical protein
MVFTKRLREGIRRGRIRCSIRVWTHAHVKVGGRYQMDEGHVVVDSIVPIRIADITLDLARESGFGSVKDLLAIARHGRGDKVYLIRFHYLRAGAWEAPPGGGAVDEDRASTLLQRIRSSTPAPAAATSASTLKRTGPRQRRSR